VEVAEWQRITTYEGYTVDSKQVVCFWAVVSSFEEDELSKLLVFARGSSTLPHAGIGTLSFVLRKVAGADRLPVAHTCEFSIDLPEYESSSELEAKLRRAMQEETFEQA